MCWKIVNIYLIKKFALSLLLALGSGSLWAADNVECREGDIQLQCPICFEDSSKDQFIVLRCKHYFCLTCVNELKKEKIELLCPLCRVNHAIWSIQKEIEKMIIEKNDEAVQVLYLHHHVIDLIVKYQNDPFNFFGRHWEVQASEMAPPHTGGYPISGIVEHCSVRSHGPEVWDEINYEYWVQRDKWGNIINAGFYQTR